MQLLSKEHRFFHTWSACYLGNLVCLNLSPSPRDWLGFPSCFASCSSSGYNFLSFFLGANSGRLGDGSHWLLGTLNLRIMPLVALTSNPGKSTTNSYSCQSNPTNISFCQNSYNKNPIFSDATQAQNWNSRIAIQISKVTPFSRSAAQEHAY